jgi:hypothetical protein
VVTLVVTLGNAVSCVLVSTTHEGDDMADPTNVVPIKPTPPKRARVPADFSKDAKTVLNEHQSRVYEALAVAKLLSVHAIDMNLGSTDIDQLEVQVRGTEAIIRLLTPVEGLYDSNDLIKQGRASGLLAKDDQNG